MTGMSPAYVNSMTFQLGSHWLPNGLLWNLPSQLDRDCGCAQKLVTLNWHSSSLLCHHGGHFYHNCNSPFSYLKAGPVQKPSKVIKGGKRNNPTAGSQL